MSRQLDFGNWSFDRDADVLSDARSTVQLEPQVAKLLEYLLGHQDQLLSRERLLLDVWGGRIVSDDAIHRCIGILRRTLSPQDKQAFIRTIPKKGYIASFPPAAEQDLGDPAAARHRRRRAMRVGGAGLVILALVIVPLAFNLGGLRDRLITGTPFESAPGHIPAEGASIAVLPFADLSPQQDQRYFAEGVSEEILSLLAKTPDLRVIARTSSFSFNGRNTDIATIAEKLGVSHVLEGSVRKAGNRIRIVVQLVDAASSMQLWSESYDRELGDVLVLQAEIAMAVAAALEVNLGLGTTAQYADQRVNPDAFDLYLRGLEQVQGWTHVSLIEAEKSFEGALERDARFVRAHYGLGLALLLQVIHEVAPLRENLPKLRGVIDRGLELMPDNAGLIALKGQVARYDGHQDLAERYLNQAMELEPSDVWVRNLYCFLKMDQGHPEDALRTQQRTLEIDPLNPAVYGPIGFSQLDLWNTDEALAAARRFKQLNSPGNVTALGMNAIMRQVLRGDYAGAIGDSLREVHTLASSELLWEAAWLTFDHYTMEDIENGDAWLERTRAAAADSEMWIVAKLEAYRLLVQGNAGPFRAFHANRLINEYDFRRVRDSDMYLLADELIERNEALRAIEFMLGIAPEWNEYRNRADLPADVFYPASALVKSMYSSYPAMHFAPFIRVLRAAGDDKGADNMLGHLETILEARRERGLFIEEIHVAEARALRGDLEGALDALEQAERDRTVYLRWQIRLLHNGIFDELRDHPRFLALIDRIRVEMSRQRAELAADRSSAHNPTGAPPGPIQRDTY